LRQQIGYKSQIVSIVEKRPIMEWHNYYQNTNKIRDRTNLFGLNQV